MPYLFSLRAARLHTHSNPAFLFARQEEANQMLDSCEGWRDFCSTLSSHEQFELVSEAVAGMDLGGEGGGMMDHGEHGMDHGDHGRRMEGEWDTAAFCGDFTLDEEFCTRHELADALCHDDHDGHDDHDHDEPDFSSALRVFSPVLATFSTSMFLGLVVS
jgi:hypothetical protein